MIIPRPFDYPTGPHSRLHGPTGYKDYQSFKPWLRDEFVFRCVYCLERERWSLNGDGSFSVDHVKPKAENRELECDYDNLVYACVRCNAWKSETEVPDPTQTPYGILVRTEGDQVVSIDQQGLGKVLIDLLHLDKEPVVTTRRRMNNLIQAWLKYPNDPVIAELFFDHFSFPDDLPVLDSRRIENTRPEGVARSHFAQKQAGTLADIY